MTMRSVNRRGTRLEKLRELAKVLAKQLDTAEDPKMIPQLAKQYRDTIREIEEAEGVNATDDEIGNLISFREAAGKPGAVRKNRAGLQGK